MATLEKEQWMIWVFFLCLTTICINWKCLKIIYSQPIRKQGYAGWETLNYFFNYLNHWLHSKWGAFKSIILTHLFLLLVTRQHTSTRTLATASRTTHLYDHNTVAQCLTPSLYQTVNHHFFDGSSLPLFFSEKIIIPTRDILNQFLFILENFLFFLWLNIDRVNALVFLRAQF